MAREKFPSDDIERQMLRFPGGLKERIAEAAKQNNRSINAEIISRLEASFAPLPPLGAGADAASDALMKAVAAEAAFQALDAMIKAIDGGAMTPEERMRILFPGRAGEEKP